MSSLDKGYEPSLETFLKSLKRQSLEASITSLISLLKRRQIESPEDCAGATAQLLLQVVAKSRWTDPDEIFSKVQEVGRRLSAARPTEVVMGNITCRVLSLIREEASEVRDDNAGNSMASSQMLPPGDVSSYAPPRARQPPPLLAAAWLPATSMFDLLAGSHRVSDLSAHEKGSGTSTPRGPAAMHSLRSDIIEGIEEIKDELSQVDEQIAAFAEAQILSTDCVLAHYPSPTVDAFLLKAASKRKFTVFSHGMFDPVEDDESPSVYTRLSRHGVKMVKLRTGVMAYMPKIDKVILNARGISADGDVLADEGSVAVATFAQVSGKPVIVLGGVFKLSPKPSFDKDALAEWHDPASLADFSDNGLLKLNPRVKKTEVVPAHLIDVYITNLGVHARNHLDGIVQDHYKSLDREHLDAALR